MVGCPALPLVRAVGAKLEASEPNLFRGAQVQAPIEPAPRASPPRGSARVVAFDGPGREHRAEADAILHHLGEGFFCLLELEDLDARTPVSALKFIVSSESIALPLGQPAISFRPSSPKVETLRGSDGAATGSDAPSSGKIAIPNKADLNEAHRTDERSVRSQAGHQKATGTRRSRSACRRSRQG
jgi:hypothetical protein